MLLLTLGLAGCATTPQVISDRTASVPILMYHHINDPPPSADEVGRTWTVSLNDFTNQMDWLVQHGYHSITLMQLVDNLESGAPLPDKPIILTFDDGWDVGFGTVFPILKQRHLIGTFFVCPGSIGENPGSGYMTWPQLREMTSGGMDVQSHTVNHPHLRGVPPEGQQREFVESKARLEKQLGRPIIALAYPFGEFDAGVMARVKQAGYRCAVGIEPGYTQHASDLFCLHRTRISYGDTLDTFKEQVSDPSK